MHWIKTKIKHILYNNFTDREFTKFMKIRAMTCQLGELPNEKQMLMVCPLKTLNSIREVLANDKQTLSEVLANDIEDASEVQDKRDYWKENKRQQREKLKPVPEDKLGQSQQHIRVDKIRLDKSRTNTVNKFTPPSLEDIKSYIEERNNSLDAELFLDHYTARGWILNNGKKVKDWKACMRTWEKKNFGEPKKKTVQEILKEI